MSDLLRAQFLHRSMVALLLAEVARLNLPIKLGRALAVDAATGPRSLHRDGLAIDLPMVKEDGSYGTYDDYLPLGLYWESVGGAWGGRFDLNADGVAKDDANHFSLAYGGRR